MLSALWNMRLYCIGSTLVTVAVIANAHTYHDYQYFPTAVRLINHTATVMLLCNQAFVVGIVCTYITTCMLFGSIRPVEAAMLYEMAWFGVTEACLAISVFREEFAPMFVAMLIILHIVQLSHALLSTRLLYMEQVPNPGRLYHIRICAVLSLLAVLDCGMIAYAIHSSLEHGPSAQFMFGFEYLLLTTSVLYSMAKYTLNLCERYNITSTHDRQVYLFYLGLCMDFVRMLIFTCFFSVIMSFYGLPLHIIRGLYISSKSFTQRLAEMLRFREATNNMNIRYPAATQQELEAADHTCVICREIMDTAKRLPCGHIFHIHCLRSWLQRQQICPICRSPVLESERIRLNLPHHVQLNGIPHVTAQPQDVPHLAPQTNQGPYDRSSMGSTPLQGVTRELLPASLPPAGVFNVAQVPLFDGAPPVAPTSMTDLTHMFSQPQPSYNCENMSLEEIWTVVIAEEARFRARFRAIRAIQSDIDRVIQRHAAMHHLFVHPPPLPSKFFKASAPKDAVADQSAHGTAGGADGLRHRMPQSRSNDKGKEKKAA
ncbi:hypothetical protein SARC_09214 [Sphaeroforma arctica JP610]|uniref:RING-type E3 ubiquitin transferase n=1 Tax=Sphaeroforma arctica JP610 TaxID=667725 RepID=A0A0L0FPB0_9EUKA|nr:hypothetical protein SARC_09214 [Sphaeroforma arctica JP610]KNC78351.1 hypothetical protein SARC_09214 [Sphaeroforma arctica JP610]|eukprot:XP_014152253.1 hypothetical protein SARC_09214 [Sphaeroforma arctica JP610]